jgi:hypothetical protein
VIRKIFILFLFIATACVKPRNEELVLNNQIEGTWIHSDFDKQIAKSKSIFSTINSMQYYPLITFEIKDTVMVQRMLTDLHDSGYDELLAISPNCLVNINQVDTTILLNDSTMIWKYYYEYFDVDSVFVTKYKKISTSLTNLDWHLQEYLIGKTILGRYVSLNNDTLEITKNGIIKFQKTIYNFKIGYDFWGREHDFLTIKQDGNRKFYKYKLENDSIYMELPRHTIQAVRIE